MLVLNPHTPGLLGVPTSHTLDALVFATDTPAIASVHVAGQAVVQHGKHVHEVRIARAFEAVMQELWGACGV